MVQKDPGGVEAQISEPPRRRCAVMPAAAALAAGHMPARLAATRDASRPPASHLKGDADGGTLQLFNLKEKKKNNTQPHKEQNQ